MEYYLLRQNEVNQLEHMLKIVNEDTTLDFNYKQHVVRALRSRIDSLHLNDYLGGSLYKEPMIGDK